MALSDSAKVAFTVKNAADYSDLSRSHLYSLMRDGKLPSVRIGGRRMIRRADLDALFEREAA